MPIPDVLVVGGGPAGLATAIRARQLGMVVQVLDRGRPPQDKACGEGLMPDARARLAALGVELGPADGVPFRGIRYLEGDLVADGDFPGGAPGLGLRRPALHQALLRRAEEVGVELSWGALVRGLRLSGREVTLETEEGDLTARWVVAADGLHSRLRRWSRLEGPGTFRKRFGVRRHYGIEPWADRVEVYWQDGCEAYVTPVGRREVGVALLWSGGAGRFDDLLGRFPALAMRLARAPRTSRDQGAGAFRQTVRRVWRGPLALVGDASGYLDPITGEGLALAFHQAFALAEALASADLRAYGREHRRLGRIPDAITATMLWLERHGRLRRRVLAALAADEALFSCLLGLHARTSSLADLGWPTLLRLGRGLLRATPGRPEAHRERERTV